MEFGVEQTKSVCVLKEKEHFSEDLGFLFFFSSFQKQGTHLLLSLADYSRALMLSPDHERNAHHEIRLEN